MTLGWTHPKRTRHVLPPKSPKLVHVSLPHIISHTTPPINGEQAQNASVIRFAASFGQERQLVQNVLVVV